MTAAYQCDDDLQRIDTDLVWRFLSEHAYWERWRTRTDVEKQISGAWRVVGCYHQPSGRQVGFARAVSDGVALAYLADVFVLPDHRGRGLGRLLVARMVTAAPAEQFRWLLHTSDAQRLYSTFGFTAAGPGLHERAPIIPR